MAREPMKTTKKQIVAYWVNKGIDECELNFDWSEADGVCWNCGHLTKHAQRCHIIPDMLGGEDTPSNYVLLCEECHEEAPNINNSEAMWDWIKHNKNDFGMYNTYKAFKAFKAFKKRNGFDFFEKAIYITNFAELFVNGFKNIGLHGAKLTISTYIYMFEDIIKKGIYSDIPQNIGFFEISDLVEKSNLVKKEVPQ